MRKGQVTIFFAIGLVLLIIVLLVVYIMNAGRQTVELENPDNPLANDHARQYLISCLDASFYDAIELLGRQGGAFLDPNIEENSPSPVRVGFDTYAQEMALAIINPSCAVPDCTSTPVNFSFLDSISPAASYESSLFGRIVIPRLCAKDGTNGLSQTAWAHCYRFAYENPFKPSPVIQDSLAKRIEVDVETCLDQDVESRSGIDLSPLGDPEVVITFADRSVHVEMTFPDYTIAASSEPRFEKDYAVRLKALYEYMIEQLVLNTRDPRNSIRDNPSSQFYRSQFAITRAMDRLTDAGINVHVYQFMDANSNFRVRGQPLTFFVAIEDRSAFEDNTVSPSVSVDPDS